MGELALAICCNAGVEVSKQCDQIIAKYGQENFLNNWLKLKNLDWAVDILVQNKSVSRNKTLRKIYESCGS